ncbi:hypothetical protein [Citrobacter portucalensis]|uniref:hypothetical protein n=1 Tax=Citrobacter portucalensis TaxID=1639133 RepID=UPI001BCE91A8|nr:hypothetical protein [Citrobacter portucalensis]
MKTSPKYGFSPLAKHGIYHNVALRAPLKSAQGDFGAKPMKTPAYQAKNPQNGTNES